MLKYLQMCLLVISAAIVTVNISELFVLVTELDTEFLMAMAM